MAVLKEALKTVRLGHGRKVGNARVVVAASLPRTVRNRSPRRKGVKPGSPLHSSQVLQHEAVSSVSGKKALGPWRGPFAAAATAASAHADAPHIPDIVWIDGAGAAHLSWDAAANRRLSMELYKAQSDSGLLSDAADAAAGELKAEQEARALMTRDVHEQGRAAQAHRLFAHAALDRTPPARNVLRKMHVINQPRRFN